MGGSPCAGKSSIADLLAARHGLRVYHCDDYFQAHGARVVPAQQPTFHKISGMTWEQIWMRPIAELVADEVQVYHEEFAMIVDDLLALAGAQPILAEGSALLPELVAGLLGDPRRAIWMVPTEAFQREYYPKRGRWVQDVVRQCSDPQQALQNWMDRDVAFAEIVAQGAAERGLEVVRVDGSCTIDEHAAMVEQWYRM
jgi:2-phosphoglycerate kinase